MASSTEAEQLFCTKVQAHEGVAARRISRVMGRVEVERRMLGRESAPRSCMGRVERRGPWMIGVRRARA
jgi:hypothetical protein